MAAGVILENLLTSFLFQVSIEQCRSHTDTLEMEDPCQTFDSTLMQHVCVYVATIVDAIV